MENVAPVFTVKSVRDAMAWYENMLEFEPVYLNEEPGEEDSLNYAVLRNGSVALHLGREQEMQTPAGQGACNFDTKEFDETYRRAKAQGVTVYIELGEIPTGQRTFGIKDPDGNLITFVEAAEP